MIHLKMEKSLEIEKGLKVLLKNDCPESIYTRDIHIYCSWLTSILMISQEDADQKAQNDININGQTTANNNAILNFYYNFL